MPTAPNGLLHPSTGVDLNLGRNDSQLRTFHRPTGSTMKVQSSLPSIITHPNRTKNSREYHSSRMAIEKAKRRRFLALKDKLEVISSHDNGNLKEETMIIFHASRTAVNGIAMFFLKIHGMRV